MLNIVESQSKIILAHREIDSKKSEIPSFQKILKINFSEKPFLYTFDTLNTQKEGLESIQIYLR